MKLTLRESLAIVFGVAMGIAAAMFGGPVAGIALFLVLVFLAALVILAVVGAREPRAFACGFLIAFVAYCIYPVMSRRTELAPRDNGRLITSQLLSRAYQSVKTVTVIDAITGEPILEHEHSSPPRRVSTQVSPDAEEFMTIGHCLIAMLLGWVGGKFGVYCYRWLHDDW